MSLLYLKFNLILCHFQVTGYEDRISLLYDCIVLGFKYCDIKFINDYIMLELMYYKNNSFLKISVIRPLLVESSVIVQRAHL